MRAESRPIADVALFAAPAVFVILWSSGFIGAKFGLPHGPPLTFLTLRMAGAVLLLGAIVAVTRPAWPDRAGMGHSLVAGLLVHGGYLGGVFIALQQGMPAGLIALVVSLQPVLISTLANRLLGERVRPQQWAGLLLGIVGVYLVVHGRTQGVETPLAWVAAIVGLLGITAGTLYQKRFCGAIDWRTGMLLQYAGSGALFALGAATFETQAVQWTGEFILALAWLVLVMSLGAVWLLYWLIRRQAATRVSSLFYLTPAVTALMAWLLFDERLAPLAIVGMAISVTGVALVNWRVARE